MRKSGRGMEGLDDRILEYLDEHGWSSPSEIASAIEFEVTANQVSDRCHVLAYHEFVAPLTEDCEFWHIDTDGQMYLRGELDASYRSWFRAARLSRP